MNALYPDKPRNKNEVQPVSRWGHLAKMAIASFLSECIDGNYKQFFTKFAPYSKYWKINTDQSFNVDPAYHGPAENNPLAKPINIVRYYEESKEKPPQIFIRDVGWTAQNQNLGGLTFGYYSQQEKAIVGEIVNNTVVSLELVAAALDGDDTSRLIHFLDVIFGPIGSSWIHHGVLYPKDNSKRSWAMTLPLTCTIGSLSDLPLGDDRKKRVWTQSVTMDVTVEHSTRATWQWDPSFSAKFEQTTVTLQIPETMRVGSSTPILVSRIPATSKLIVNDCSKAIILTNNTLFAKRTGSVVVSLISTNSSFVHASANVEIIP